MDGVMEHMRCGLASQTKQRLLMCRRQMRYVGTGVAFELRGFGVHRLVKTYLVLCRIPIQRAGLIAMCLVVYRVLCNEILTIVHDIFRLVLQLLSHRESDICHTARRLLQVPRRQIQVCSMLAEIICPRLPLLLRVLHMLTPLRHQLQPMFPRLLDPHRQRMSVCVNILTHHVHQLLWQLRIIAHNTFIRNYTTLLQYRHKLSRQLVQRLFASWRVGPEQVIGVPRQLLRRDVGCADDALARVDEPKGDEAAVSWFFWIDKAKGRDLVLPDSTSLAKGRSSSTKILHCVGKSK